MNYRKVLRIIAFEISAAIRQKGFWLAPLIIPAMVCVGLIGSGLLAGKEFDRPEHPTGQLRSAGGLNASGLPVALYDGTKTFYQAGAVCDPMNELFATRILQWMPGVPFGNIPETRCFESLQEALAAVKEKKARAAVEIPPTFLETGVYTVYSDGNAELSWALSSQFENYHRQLLIETSSMSQSLKRRLRGTSTTREMVLRNGTFVDKSSKQARPWNYAEIIGKAGKPAIACLGLFLLVTSFGIGLNCTHTERNSHLIEVILSSVTATEYLLGKIVSVTLLNSFQIVTTFSLTLIPAMYRFRFALLAALPHLSVPALSTSLLCLSIFGIGSFLASAAGAGAGVLSTPENTSRKGRPVSMSVVTYAALYFAGGLIFSDNASTKLFLSYLPPFSVFLMPQRLLFHEAAFSEGVMALAILAVATLATAAISARMLRLCLSFDSVWGLLRKCLSPFRMRRIAA